MKVHIENNLYLESDGMQFIIKEYTGTIGKDGKEISRSKGYFGSVESALQHVLKMKVMESTANDLKTLIEDVRALQQYIKNKIDF